MASYSSGDEKAAPTMATTLAMANEIKNDKKRRRLSELRRKRRRRRRKQNKKEEEPLIVEEEQRPKFERANFMLTPEAPKPTGKMYVLSQLFLK